MSLFCSIPARSSGADPQQDRHRGLLFHAQFAPHIAHCHDQFLHPLHLLLGRVIDEFRLRPAGSGVSAMDLAGG